MGNGSSKSESSISSSSTDEGKSGSRISRLKEKLRLHRRLRRGSGSGSGSTLKNKLIDAEDFAGIALLTLISAEMKFKDKWLACVSFGEQTFRSQISDQLTQSSERISKHRRIYLKNFSCLGFGRRKIKVSKQIREEM